VVVHIDDQPIIFQDSYEHSSDQPQSHKATSQTCNPSAAEQVRETTSVGGTQLKSLEAKPEEKTEATLAPTVIAPEDNMQTIHAGPRYGASISVQNEHGEMHHGIQTVALMKELVEQEGATVYLQCGETNEVKTTIIQEDNKMHKLLEEAKTCIDHWNKNEGKLYLPTPSLEKCQKILTEEGHLNIFGLSGQGKTALAYNLIEASEHSVFLSSPEEWRQIDKEKCKLIILDDIFEADRERVARRRKERRYNPTSLQRTYKYDLLMEHDLGDTIDLINQETYQIEPNGM
ncbi:hypothetical protein ScPMuIL_005152, partial [Solemya velum]